jgi:hypothetical protein
MKRMYWEVSPSNSEGHRGFCDVAAIVISCSNSTSTLFQTLFVSLISEAIVQCSAARYYISPHDLLVFLQLFLLRFVFLSW